MKKQFGVVGHKGKIGSRLVTRADFLPVDIDITSSFDGNKAVGWADVVVNCAGMSSIEQCESAYVRAIDLNVTGLRNLHTRCGSRILNIGSEQIYGGNFWFTPKETTSSSPINAYGLTKVAAEAISNAFGGKTIRLSRSITVYDPDIMEYLNGVRQGNRVFVPIYMTRNYLPTSLVVNGIEFFARHYDDLPHIVNYGALERYTYYELVRRLVKELGFDSSLVKIGWIPDKKKLPRPLFSGLNCSLAGKLGFPMYDLDDTVSTLKAEYEKSLRGSLSL